MSDKTKHVVETHRQEKVSGAAVRKVCYADIFLGYESIHQA